LRVKFQSTRPRGARLLPPTTLRRYLTSFNPRAHAGRDCHYDIIDWLQPVSIHAPTRGATRFKGDNLVPEFTVSIHAPTRGATTGKAEPWAALQFQSTRPRGARQIKETQFQEPTGFNPRAHAGRDVCVCHLYWGTVCFNPRAHAGRDQRIPGYNVRTACFNPRAHAGRDMPRLRNWLRFPSFNPRAHAGRDHHFD